MSKLSWLDSLAEKLAQLSRDQPDGLARPPRLAIVGVGHELRGDDAAGLLVARQLVQAWQQRSWSPAGDRLLIIEAGHAPENHTGPIRRFAPDLVLMVDAAQMNEPPGCVRWLAWQEISGLSASTHTMPLYMLAKYLTSELGCDVALIGIQPADTALGAPLSPPVQRAINQVAQALAGSCEGQVAGRGASRSAPTPLEIIRAREAEVTRRLAAAREAAVADVAVAEGRARQLISQTQAEGQREGEAQRQRLLAEAELEAAAILAQAADEVARLQHISQTQMAAAVARALNIVIGDSSKMKESCP
jgi:hydrogenase 3 maturation protease